MEPEMDSEDDLEGVESELFQSKPQELEECPVCSCRISGLVLHEDGIWRCPLCHTRFFENVVIEVKAIDHGEYPPEIGSAMVGMLFMAMRNGYPSWDKSGRWYKSEDAYVVGRERFLLTLQTMSPTAYEWYAKHSTGRETAMFFKKREAEEVTVVLEVEPYTLVDDAMIWEIINNQDKCLEGTDLNVAYRDF